MADRHDQLRRDLEARITEAKLYRTSDAYRAFGNLLMALDNCYSEDLRTENQDRASKVRAASSQCRALLDTMTDRGDSASPKI